jgi:hypothetical protein
MRIGDVSRQRRFADPVRQRWYAHHRALRFARRMGCGHHAAVRQGLIILKFTPTCRA